MYRGVISPSANADLFNALNYIAYKLGNPLAATRLADGIERCYADLEEFPDAHELCRDPVLARMGYRRYPVSNYLVIFRIVEEVLRRHHLDRLDSQFAPDDGECGIAVLSLDLGGVPQSAVYPIRSRQQTAEPSNALRHGCDR